MKRRAPKVAASVVAKDLARDLLVQLVRQWRIDAKWIAAVEAGDLSAIQGLGEEAKDAFDASHAALTAALRGAK